MQPTGYFGGGADSLPNKKSRRKLLILLLLVLVVLVAIVGIFSAITSSGSKTKDLADNFMSHYTSGDSAGSFALLSPELQASETEEGWDKKVSDNKDFFSAYTLRSDTIEEDNESGIAIYDYVTTGGDGTYLLSVYVSETTAGNRVSTFEYAPYYEFGKNR